MRLETGVHQCVAADSVFLFFRAQLNCFNKEVVKLAFFNINFFRQGSVDYLAEVADGEKLSAGRKLVVLFLIKTGKADNVISPVGSNAVDEIAENALLFVGRGNLPLCNVVSEKVADAVKFAELQKVSVRFVIFNLLFNRSFVKARKICNVKLIAEQTERGNVKAVLD